MEQNACARDGKRRREATVVEKSDMRGKLPFLILCAAMALSACTESRQARETRATSGFLGDDYSLLREGSGDEALLVYRKPAVDWRAYDRIRLAPVTLWGEIGRASCRERGCQDV